MRYKKEQILQRLNTVLEDENALLKERLGALKILLKHDRENTISKVEKMYDESHGMAHVNLAELMLRILKTETEKEIDGDVDFG